MRCLQSIFQAVFNFLRHYQIFYVITVIVFFFVFVLNFEVFLHLARLKIRVKVRLQSSYSCSTCFRLDLQIYTRSDITHFWSLEGNELLYFTC